MFGRLVACVFMGLGGTVCIAGSPARPDPVPGYSANDLRIVEGNLWYTIIPCEIAAPEFVARHARTYESYRRRHAAAIAHLQARREYAATVRSWQTPGARQQVQGIAAMTCTDKMVAGLERYGRDPDPRFSTPQGSWDFLKASLLAANRADALLVVSRNDVAFIEDVAKVSDQELRVAGDRMGRLEIVRSEPERVWAIHQPNHGWQPGRPEFEKIFGEWYLTHSPVYLPTVR